jgi:diacylglycerol kinase
LARLASPASPPAEPPLAQPPRVRRVVRSFGYAFEGLVVMLRTQPNFLVHTAAAIVALALGVLLRLSPAELAVIVLTIAIVLVIECVNTALESLSDLVSPEFHPLIKNAKDISAAAVLIGAIASVVVAVLLFGPHLVAVFK